MLADCCSRIRDEVCILTAHIHPNAANLTERHFTLQQGTNSRPTVKDFFRAEKMFLSSSVTQSEPPWETFLLLQDRNEEKSPQFKKDLE